MSSRYRCPRLLPIPVSIVGWNGHPPLLADHLSDIAGSYLESEGGNVVYRLGFYGNLIGVIYQTLCKGLDEIAGVKTLCVGLAT
jgi:hypothetical protein